MPDRYYVHLEDERCMRSTWEVCDRLLEVDSGYGPYSIKVFEADEEDQARDYTRELNDQWESTTKDELGVELSKAKGQARSMEVSRDIYRGFLGSATSLLVRMYHERLTGQREITTDADLEGFMDDHQVRRLMPDDVVPVAYDDGLPVDRDKRRRLWKARGVPDSHQSAVEQEEFRQVIANVRPE